MKKQPNVLFIIADQWSTKHGNGSGKNRDGLQTPGLDALAAEGVRFENSYSAFPLCCPARATMFTGVMPHEHRITHNEEQFVYAEGKLPSRDDLPTMGECFKKAGYETAYFGKEHAGGYGWDAMDTLGSFSYSGGGMLAEGSAYDSIFTRDAIDYIKQDHAKPFYMTLSLINPHDICKVLGGKVQGATFADAIFFCRDDSETYLRNTPRAHVPSNHEAGTLPGMIRENDYMFEEMKSMNENDWKRYISTYNLLVEKTDWYIQLVLETLKQQGLADDTIVVFTTDHGDMMGAHGIIAKTNFYEESANTQLIMRYPDVIKAGIVNQEAMISTQDLMPTFLDLCGIEIPSSVTGKSFKAALNGEQAGHEYVFSMNYDSRMVRFENYKYIKSEMDGRMYEILIDLKNDPDETTNFSGVLGYEDIKARGKALLEAYLAQEKLNVKFSYSWEK